MTTATLARHIAMRLERMSDANSLNAADTLRALADQLDSLTHTVELMNAECIRLAKDRDALRLENTELKALQADRRARPRA